MKPSSIKSHLRPYEIGPKRKTTIHHAFASALAPVEVYDEERVRAAMRVLGQRDLEALACVYCDAAATTWDHLEALVRDSRPSGHGHTVGNLVPACRHCNSERGNKPWRDWMAGKGMSVERIARLQTYHETFRVGGHLVAREDLNPESSRRLREIEEKIVALMQEADDIIRAWRTAESPTVRE